MRFLKLMSGALVAFLVIAMIIAFAGFLSRSELSFNMPDWRWKFWRNDESTVLDATVDAEELSRQSQILAAQMEALTPTDISLDIATIMAGEQGCENRLPENLFVVIAETKDYRLGTIDTQNLPCRAKIAIWPDSPLTLSEKGYLLINPPTDIMELYYVQAATADLEGFYEDAITSSSGFFIRRGGVLVEKPALRDLLLRQMTRGNKAVVVWEENISEDFIKSAEAAGTAFAPIDAVLNEDPIEKQWQRILSEANGDGERFVLIEANGENVDQFKALIGAGD